MDVCDVLTNHVNMKLMTCSTWGFPKIGVPLVIIHFSGIFHEINEPFWGSPFMETLTCTCHVNLSFSKLGDTCHLTSLEAQPNSVVEHDDMNPTAINTAVTHPRFIQVLHSHNILSCSMRVVYVYLHVNVCTQFIILYYIMPHYHP